MNDKAISILKELRKQDLNDEQVLKIIGNYSEYLMLIDYLLNDKKAVFKYKRSDEFVTDEVRYLINPTGEDLLLQHKQKVNDNLFAKITSIIALIGSFVSIAISLLHE